MATLGAARLRQKPCVTQEELVARLAVRGVLMDRTAISRIEAQQRSLRDYEIVEIAKCLEVEVAWLFEN
jgi:HTH-type transcriptional regulator, cell division transcriptional repressor